MSDTDPSRPTASWWDRLRPRLLFLFIPFALLIPRRLHPWLARSLVHLFLRTQTAAREVVTENLRGASAGHASPRALRATVRRLFIHYGLYLLDYMSLPFRRRADVIRIFGGVRGTEHFTVARARGRGVLLVGPHVGNWELGGYLLREHDVPVNVLSIRDPHPVLERFRARFRDREGLRLIHVGGPGDSTAILEMREALARQEAVALLGDRVYSGRFRTVPFFATRIALPEGPLRLSVATGAPIVPFVTVREGDVYFLHDAPPIELEDDSPGEMDRAATSLASCFEDFVRRYPDQWYQFRPAFALPGGPHRPRAPESPAVSAS